VTHGTTSAYAHDYCRCVACKRMWAAYHRAYARVKRLLGRCARCSGPSAGYCCLTCREKRNDYFRARRAAQKLRRAA